MPINYEGIMAVITRYIDGSNHFTTVTAGLQRAAGTGRAGSAGRARICDLELGTSHPQVDSVGEWAVMRLSERRLPMPCSLSGHPTVDQ